MREREREKEGKVLNMTMWTEKKRERDIGREKWKEDRKRVRGR